MVSSSESTETEDSKIFIFDKSVGVVAVTEQESSRITNGTASAVGDSKKHIVELEMFHQFHCLVGIHRYVDHHKKRQLLMLHTEVAP